jgi:hypothetical protein
MGVTWWWIQCWINAKLALASKLDPTQQGKIYRSSLGKSSNDCTVHF